MPPKIIRALLLTFYCLVQFLAFVFFAMTDTRFIHKFPKLSPFRLKFSRRGLSPGVSMALFRLRNRAS